MSTPEDDDGSAVPLFLTVKNEFIVEKNFAGKVKIQILKRQHRDPRIKLPFPAQCRVLAFETDIHKDNSVIFSVLTLLSIFYKQLVGNSLSVN